MKNADLPIPDLADRLPFCPRCAYPFMGLPEKHRCPECGLAYDTDSLMWIGAKNKSFFGQFPGLILPMVLTVVLSLPMIWMSFVSRGQLQPYFAFLILLNFATPTLLVLRWKRWRYGPPPFLAVMPDGVWYRSGHYKTRFVQWSRISEVSFLKALWTLYLQLNNRMKVTVRISGVFDSEETLQLAQDAIKARNQQRSPSLDGRPLF